MENRIEKILNHWVLLAVNISIIIIAELSGNYFVEKGIIHLVAVLFVILGISRIFIHYDAYDNYLRPLIWGGSAALVVFSISHLVEFLGYAYFKIYEDSIFINVVNFYIVSMLMISAGADYFLRTLKNRGAFITRFLMTVIIALFAVIVLIFSNQIRISLEPGEPIIYIYTVLVLLSVFFSISQLVKIKKHTSIMIGFANYFIAALVLIGISALQYVFYDILGEMGVPSFQVMYISHFLFYGALSLIFLAFASLSNLKGIYQEAEKSEEYKNFPKT